MKLLYFDCFSGISGDMVLGALLDAGADLAQIEAALRRLPVTGWMISAEKVTRGAICAAHVHVATSEKHRHRSLGEILEMIAGAGLPPRAAVRAAEIFRRLGEAEAKVHGVPVEQVHFHEVGAVDAIVDIVGACLGFELLGIEQFACSALNVGGGRVHTAHGILPVPAPATAELLRQAPTYSSGVERELATPTGAAIVAALAAHFGPLPPMKVAQIGYGAGSAELTEQPNVLRVFVGEALETEAGTRFDETVTVIEANLDDMNPQIYGYFAERAVAAGALDVFATPVQMKKGRPGQLVTVLCAPQDTNRLVELIFAETTTIGVRLHQAQRRTLEREIVPVETPFGTVQIKVARMNGRVLNAAPEYEDCRRIAAERGVPLKQVFADALAQFHLRNGGDK